MTKLFIIFLLATVLCPTGNALASCVTLTWTAPGDNGMDGTATRYAICYSTSEISEQTWGEATAVKYPPRPKPSGTVQRFTVAGLEPGVVYYFALKSADEKNNWSPISNLIARTAPPDDCVGQMGNADCDPSEIVDIGDISAYIRALFIDLEPICCLAEADVNSSGDIDIADLTIVLKKLFSQPGPLPTCP